MLASHFVDTYALEVLTGTVVQLVCLFIFASGVGLDCLLDRLNGTAEKVRVAHATDTAGLCAAATTEVEGCTLARSIVSTAERNT